MAILNVSNCTPHQMYHLMVQTIIPRPIAWVLSQNKDASLNLAPFSYFNGVSSDPPLVMISVGKKSNGLKKDTWVNIQEGRPFVIHIAGTTDRQNVTGSSESLDYGVSEPERLKLKTTPVEGWPLPRIASCKAAFLCGKYRIIEIGDKPQGLILAQIQSLWLEDTILEEKAGHYLVDTAGIDPLARLGKDQYGAIRILPDA